MSFQYTSWAFVSPVVSLKRCIVPLSIEKGTGILSQSSEVRWCSTHITKLATSRSPKLRSPLSNDKIMYRYRYRVPCRRNRTCGQLKFPLHKILLTGPWAECAVLLGPCEYLFIFPSTHICLPWNHSSLHIWRRKYFKPPFLHMKTYKLLACFSIHTTFCNE